MKKILFLTIFLFMLAINFLNAELDIVRVGSGGFKKYKYRIPNDKLPKNIKYAKLFIWEAGRYNTYNYTANFVAEGEKETVSIKLIKIELITKKNSRKNVIAQIKIKKIKDSSNLINIPFKFLLNDKLFKRAKLKFYYLVLDNNKKEEIESIINFKDLKLPYSPKKKSGLRYW